MCLVGCAIVTCFWYVNETWILLHSICTREVSTQLTLAESRLMKYCGHFDPNIVPHSRDSFPSKQGLCKTYVFFNYFVPTILSVHMYVSIDMSIAMAYNSVNRTDSCRGHIASICDIYSR